MCIHIKEKKKNQNSKTPENSCVLELLRIIFHDFQVLVNLFDSSIKVYLLKPCSHAVEYVSKRSESQKNIYLVSA